MSGKRTNIIVERIQLAVLIKLSAPLCISNGENEFTDTDVIRDGDGHYFIPGTSIAGAMRGYTEYTKEEDCLFGYSKINDGKMSRVFLSDINLFTEDIVIKNGKTKTLFTAAKTKIRDGIKLSQGKITEAGAKFDMEIVETGTGGYLYMDVIIREKDKKETIVEELQTIFAGIQNGDIRLGHRKNRGFGKLQIVSIKELAITRENKELLLKGTIREKKERLPEKKENWIGAPKDKYIKLNMPLKQQGAISIREYHVKKNEPDFSHITCNGEPVIPGSSWNGAIRSCVIDIMKHYHIATEENISTIFGFVKKEVNESAQSMVVIEESVLKEAKEVLMVRNKISRFEAATVVGALYKELSYAEGKTELRINIKKNGDYKWVVGLFLLALYELGWGMLPVGGQTAVGRGIFEKDGDIMLSTGTEQEYLQSFLSYVKSKGEV